MRASFLSLPLIFTYAAATKIIISNDDGWATAQIRQQFDALTSAGHNVILSSPALNQSGKSSLSKTPTALTEPCEFDTCPTGSPAMGFNSSNTRLNYVNGYPVDAARYGIQTLAPKFFNGGAPDFVVSGPNVGSNLGLVALLSGTVGAACEAARTGIPAGAFSGVSGSEVSYTTLSSTPDATSSVAARIYSDLTTTFVKTLASAAAANSGPYLPPGVIVNVNYASVDNCASAASYQWVFSRLVWNIFETDVETCGSDHLPTESTVVGKGCYASVSVIDAQSKLDVNATLQAQVRDKLQGLPLVCLP
ncbi:sure-like protein [Trametes versicolor FP-101664 SS1]|uniref:sure-like protein n=1 Tax=Trametes versicolor (strain FP-101664) TaxID=717944 RepID=UPI000462153C|nr:sure-like protein [Trametes versicolor FP-101664 SS1]EIW56696.1 sure-like protein [Trametes versicolor FP-101664 SS1]